MITTWTRLILFTNSFVQSFTLRYSINRQIGCYVNQPISQSGFNFRLDSPTYSPRPVCIPTIYIPFFCTSAFVVLIKSYVTTEPTSRLMLAHLSPLDQCLKGDRGKLLLVCRLDCENVPTVSHREKKKPNLI